LNMHTGNITKILFITVLKLFSGGVHSPARSDSVSASADISADIIEYDNEEMLLEARGNVIMNYKDIEFNADRIFYFRKNEKIEARGNVFLKRSEYELTADDIVFYLRSSTGTVRNTRISAPPMYVSSDKVFIKGEKDFRIPSGEITTCDHDPPHYRFSGSDINLQLGSFFSSWNMLLYVRGLPTLYYPYYFRNLGDIDLEWDVDIGRSNSMGYYAKAVLSYPFSDNSRTYGGLDVMLKKGLGVRLGHEYSYESGQAEAKVYYLRDMDENKSEFKVDLDGWQDLSDDLSLNYRTSYTSLRDLGMRYDPREQEYVRDTLYYQAEGRYTGDRLRVSAYGDRTDTWVDGAYEIEEYILPGLRMRFPSFSLPAGLSMRAQTKYENIYNPDNDFWQSNLSWDSRVNTSYRIISDGRYFMNFYPSVGYDGKWQERYEEKSYLSHYLSFSAGVRQGLFNMFFLDTNYRWRRQVEDPWERKTSHIENRLSLMPYRGMRFSAAFDYDFNETGDEPLGDFILDFEYRRNRSRFFARNRYNYYEEKFMEQLYMLDIADISQTRVRYDYLRPGVLDIFQNVSFGIGSFQLTPGVRFNLEKTDKAPGFEVSEVLEKSLNVRWDMHCWESELRFLKRGRETELWLLFNIAAFPERKAGGYSRFLYDSDGSLVDDDYGFHSE